MTRRMIGLLLAGAGLLAVLGFVALREEPVPVDLFTVTAAPMRITIDADGQTRIREIFEVAAPIAGTAQRAPVAVGDRVQAGQSIVARVAPAAPALLDWRSRTQAEAAVAEAQAALDLARADLARAEEERRFAALQRDRSRALVERGVAALTQMETASQQLAVAEAALRAAQARSAMAQGNLDRARATLSVPTAGDTPDACCVALSAPIDGVVLSITMISEHPVQPGAPLVSIGDPGDLEIVADLLSADAVALRPGTAALVERWGGSDPLRAVLERIDPVAETRVSALGIAEQRVDAVFRITTPPAARPGLGHGFAVFLRIITWESDSTLQVPIGALFRREAGWAVYVMDNGRAREKAVSIGQRGTRMVQVLGGLSEGEIIITHPGAAVRDGVKVVDRRDR